MYGQNLYGLTNYGHGAAVSETDLENHYIDIAQYAPPFFRDIREMAQIYRTEGYELGLLQYYLDDLVKQAFVSTATWGLVYWEEQYGITTNLSLTNEDRREIICARMRGQGTTTIAMIKQTAEAFSGGEVDVIEDNPNHLFIVRFVGIKGIPRSMQAFINMLEDIKPAHLAYTFEYRYTVWNNMNAYKWIDLNTQTWSTARTMKED